MTAQAGHASVVASTPTDFPGDEFLLTRRMRLRGLRLADVPSLLALNSDPEVSQWLLEPFETNYFAVAKVVFRANETYLSRPGLGAWHASDHDARFLGIFSLMPLQDTADEVEIGTRLNRIAWGKLIAVEGGRALCAHAFDALRLPRLVGMCHPHNAAVPAILRRLGFAADGTAPYYGCTALRFVLERDEWLRRKSAAAESTMTGAPAEESVP